MSTFDFSTSDSVIVLTKGERDVETLETPAKFELGFVGMLASRQRVRDDLARLRKGGVSEQFVSSLRAPVGASMGAATAPEIVLRIMAEAVAAKYDKDVLGNAPS